MKRKLKYELCTAASAKIIKIGRTMASNMPKTRKEIKKDVGSEKKKNMQS